MIEFLEYLEGTDFENQFLKKIGRQINWDNDVIEITPTRPDIFPDVPERIDVFLVKYIPSSGEPARWGLIKHEKKKNELRTWPL